MNRKILIHITVLFMLLAGCQQGDNFNRENLKKENEKKGRGAKKSMPINLGAKAKDSSKYIYIDDFIITPSESFDYNSTAKANDDTLALVSCADFIYFPFGKMQNEKEALTSPFLKCFDKENLSRKKDGRITSEKMELKYKSSYLKLYFDNDDEASVSSYITRGFISDTAIRFINGIEIGMNKKKFFTVISNSFPEKLIQEFKVVVFESCVEGIRHICVFENEKLRSIKFECVGCMEGF